MKYSMYGLHCPGCGHMFVRATAVTEQEAPTPGSVHICLTCNAVSVMDAGPLGLAMRSPTAGEYLDLMQHPMVAMAMDVAKRYRCDP